MVSSKEEILRMQICECGEKSVAEAIDIFQNTSLPFKKAKKLVTECNKTCCRAALMRLYDMQQFGKYDYDEIEMLIEKRLERTRRLIEGV
jgi:ethanolamine utilization protein EutQ (cupin superfamily)